MLHFRARVKGKRVFSSHLCFSLLSALLSREECPHSFRDAEWRTSFARVQNIDTAHYAPNLVQVIFKTLNKCLR